jgi:periplasmic divalent cation tolerance protein
VGELCEVVITAPDPDWLCAFARSLVEDRLAASAHDYAPGPVDLPMAGPGA